jgi:hypothetical protein
LAREVQFVKGKQTTSIVSSSVNVPNVLSLQHLTNTKELLIKNAQRRLFYMMDRPVKVMENAIGLRRIQ